MQTQLLKRIRENPSDHAHEAHALAPASIRRLQADLRIRFLTGVVRENPERKWLLSKMAVLVCLSPSYLSRLFHAHNGLSPKQFVKAVKLQYARELLCTTFCSIKEITAKVGIDDASHFSRDFRRMFGSSPAAYRKRSQASSSMIGSQRSNLRGQKRPTNIKFGHKNGVAC